MSARIDSTLRHFEAAVSKKFDEDHSIHLWVGCPVGMLFQWPAAAASAVVAAVWWCYSCRPFFYLAAFLGNCCRLMLAVVVAASVACCFHRLLLAAAVASAPINRLRLVLGVTAAPPPLREGSGTFTPFSTWLRCSHT